MCKLDRNRLRPALTALAVLGAVIVPVLSGAQEAKPAATTAISLSEAIHRAQQSEPVFAAAMAAHKSAAVDRYLAKSALLPSVAYHNQVLYTQPNGQTNQGGQVGTQASPVFIANNAIREYTSQAVISDTIGLKQLADVQIASANAARASAELEIARRGLVATVVSLYYSVSASETKRTLYADAFREAQTFTDLTQQREAAREVAHADVVKAQLQQQLRERDLRDASVSADRARLELAILLFPDPRTPYSTEAPGPPPALPTRDEVNLLGAANNAEIRSALAELRVGNAEVLSARAAYLPDLAFNFSYGIDAPQFAKRGPDDVRNLGYSITGTLDIRVWDWFSTQKRIKQSEIRRDVAKVSLTASQRRLIATLEEAYAEAAAARDQLNLLERSVSTAAESLRLTKLRYSAGESTALEVVDAQSTYLLTEIDQTAGVVRYESALAELQLFDWNTMSAMRRQSRQVATIRRLAPIATMLLCGVFLQACKKEPDTSAAALVTVQAEHPEVAAMAEHITADAILSPLAQAAISPKITAPIRTFYVQRGSRVKAGQLLAVLENKDLVAQAQDNQGQYKGSAGHLRHPDKGTDSRGLHQGRTRRSPDQSATRSADPDHGRATETVERGGDRRKGL